MEKNGKKSVIVAIAGYVIAMGACVGTYIVSTIRSDKRMIKSYQKLDEASQAQIDYYKKLMKDS